MSTTTDSTTLICLFHHDDQAQAALRDLENAGVAPSAISTVGGRNSGSADISDLEALGVPQRDLKHLREGLADGGVVIAVSAATALAGKVESIFGAHKAEKIDETELDTGEVLPAVAAAGAAIPVVEEELVVGKRTVDQGGVRVYKRIVEIPAEETVTLREEHVVIERNPVDRAATPAELGAQSRSIELIETAEEAVVGKTARVVEEVVVGKEAGERTERIRDSVRRTEVEVEEIPSAETLNTTTGTYKSY